MNEKYIEDRLTKEKETQDQPSIIKHREEREANNLSLRKNNLDTYIIKKRLEMQSKMTSSTPSNYEVKWEELNLPDKITGKSYQSIEDFSKEMISFLKSGDISYIKFALCKIRIETIVNTSNIDKLYKQNICEPIYEAIKTNAKDKQIIYEGIWIFINLTTIVTDVEFYRSLLSPLFMALYTFIIQSNDFDLILNWCWLLCNIIKESEIYISYFLREETAIRFIVKSFLPYIESQKHILVNLLSLVIDICTSFARSTAWAVMEKNKINEDEIRQLQESLAKIFCEYVESKVDHVCVECFWSLNAWCEMNNPLIFKEVFKSGIIRKIVLNKVSYPNGALINETYIENIIIQFIGNAICGIDNSLLDPIVNKELVWFLTKFIMNTPIGNIKKDAWWAWSNICCGSYAQIQDVFDSKVIPHIINSVLNDDVNIGAQGVYCLSFLVISGNSDHKINLLDQDIMTVFLRSIETYLSKKDIIDQIWQAFVSFFMWGEEIKMSLTNSNIFLDQFIRIGGKEIIIKLLNYADSKVMNDANLINLRFWSGSD